MTKLPFEFSSEEECQSSHADKKFADLHCNSTWDTIMCWPPTPRNTTVALGCPPHKGVDTSKMAFRKCSDKGRWESAEPTNDTSVPGWTNYTNCFTPEILDLMKKLYSHSEEDAQIKISIAQITRIIEIVGLSLSVILLLVSSFIFFYFRSLRNPRTRIHQNLFISTTIQACVRLTLYVDQMITREQSNRGIDNTPVLCESFYCLLEYARTCMFMWMFIEGLYLHNMITVCVFTPDYGSRTHSLIAWGLPFLLTSLWAVSTGIHYGLTECWWGYNFTPYFWILEGPRLFIIGLNIIFLSIILTVVVRKLRNTDSTESNRTKIIHFRKAVKATFVLLPLLGIPHIIGMIEAPLERSIWEFAAWAFTSHFLSSFQGVIISCLYCFFNGEVRAVMSKRMTNISVSRAIMRSTRKDSVFSSYTAANPVGHETDKKMRCCFPSPRENSDTPMELETFR